MFLVIATPSTWIFSTILNTIDILIYGYNTCIPKLTTYTVNMSHEEMSLEDLKPDMPTVKSPL
jgi:hypothetical protein